MDERFLTYRKFSVQVESYQSEFKIYNLGVPQGSILGPYLYNIYVSDILNGFDLPNNLSLKQYADDLQAYSIFESSDTDLAAKSFDKLIEHLYNWGKKNGLKFSSEKFELLHLGKNNPKRSYNINGTIIQPTSCVRNLGLQMTDDLKFNTHINNKCLSATRRWFNLAKVCRHNDINVLSLIYKQFVRPILEYPSIIFNPITVTLINDLERVQRRITRHILFRTKYKSPLPPYEERMKLLNLETLEARRNKLDMIFYSKVINNEVQINSKNIPKRVHNINTRFSNKRANILPARLNVRRNSFFVRVPKIFSKLPTQVTNANTSELLRTYLKPNKTEIPSYRLT